MIRTVATLSLIVHLLAMKGVVGMNRLDPSVGIPTDWVPPGSVRVGGLLGRRFFANERNRLLPMDETALLTGFRNRPGPQAWIGEHIGKWLDAASLTYQVTGNQALKEKMDRLVAELLKTQEPDGYLGTYDRDHRWSLGGEFGWDVWVHKYVLIGLLSYYRVTGDRSVLEAAERVGHLLVRTFGAEPGKLDLCERSTHVGMASSSVLQPMVWLYTATGEASFLNFCRYILWSWDHSTAGPKIISTLKRNPKVHQVANAKAYEMMSCLLGVLELARALDRRGEKEEAKDLRQAVLSAWDDIVTYRLYITGGTSLGEFFQEDHYLPNGGPVAETCAVVTLLQLTWELFRETGQCRFMDVAETIIFNHLLGAQHPEGDRWCYFTPLQGWKDYRQDINCCASSGPRGVAFLPFSIYSLDPDGGIRINLFCESELNLKERHIRIVQQTDYPYDGQVTVTVRTPAPIRIRTRIPSWGRDGKICKDGEAVPLEGRGGQYLEWLVSDGQTIRVALTMEPEVVKGTGLNQGRIALRRGPLILSLDESLFRSVGRLWTNVTITREQKTQPTITLLRRGKTESEAPFLFQTQGMTHRRGTTPEPFQLILTDFAFAGAEGGRIRLWLPDPDGTPEEESLFAFAKETRSRWGNVIGSICDEHPQTWVVTYDGTKRDEDWFAVESDMPQKVRRIVFYHGRTYHDGGWFDTSQGKPQVQVRRQLGGPWETVGRLETYPETTATDPRGLLQGEPFELVLKEPVICFGIRVIGRPACGDNQTQSFSSCAELKGFSDLR